MKNVTILFLIFISFACINRKSKSKLFIRNKKLKQEIVEQTKDSLNNDDYLIDSVNIGISGLYKIELKKITELDSSYVFIKLYEKHKNSWLEVQKMKFLKDEVLSCDPKLSDFNNDGYKDFTYQSTLAARGANEIRKLFIFDKITHKLNYIKNSENYPNLLYNEKLKCIDAFLVYGGTSTVFLNLEKDSLKEFASVALDEETINITTTDKNGNQKYIVKDKKNNIGVYVRFKNFNPLEINENFE